MVSGIQIRKRSKLAAIFSAFPQGFNTDYSSVSRIKPPHCFAGGAVKQNGWDFVFIADNLLYFHKQQHFSNPFGFVCIRLFVFFCVSMQWATVFFLSESNKISLIIQYRPINRAVKNFIWSWNSLIWFGCACSNYQDIKCTQRVWNISFLMGKCQGKFKWMRARNVFTDTAEICH